MVYRERDEVEKIKLEHSKKEKPDYDLSLTPYFKTMPNKITNHEQSNNVILGAGYNNVSIIRVKF